MTSPVGVARPRPDAAPKVRGATRYAADRPRRGLLHARLVLATHAHARIVAIDAAAALETPGVVAVLSAADLPIKAKAWDRSTLPLARSEVVFAGQPASRASSPARAGTHARGARAPRLGARGRAVHRRGEGAS